MKKKSFFNSSLFYSLLSLLFAVLLVFYVNQGKLTKNSNQSSNITQTQLTSTKNDHIQMPLQLNVNNSKYFVTGYPDKVNVKLSGPSALVTTTVNTQNFKIYVDLTKLSVGQHRIKIQQSGLNNAIQCKIVPSYITVNIQPRKTASFPIETHYSSGDIASGYQAGKATTSEKTVKATGSMSNINKIDKIIAKLNLPSDSRKTVNYQTILEAVDKKGKTVNVILTPSTTTVNLPITSGNSKTLPLKVNATNKSDGKSYVLMPEVKNVKAFGSKAQLAKIKQIKANLDVSGINSTTTKTIQLDESLNNVTGFNQSKIKVKVQVK